MFEAIEAIFKGLGTLLRITIENGSVFDISLSRTGRFFIKSFYPPHWNKTATYNHAAEIIVGVFVWALLGYGAYYLYHAL